MSSPARGLYTGPRKRGDDQVQLGHLRIYLNSVWVPVKVGRPAWEDCDGISIFNVEFPRGFAGATQRFSGAYSLGWLVQRRIRREISSAGEGLIRAFSGPLAPLREKLWTFDAQSGWTSLREGLSELFLQETRREKEE